MSRWFLAIAVLIAVVLPGCSPALPRWRQDARIALDAARLEGADKTLPAEYDSALDIFGQGEALLQEGDVEDAEACYRFALLKGRILEQDFAAEKARRAEEARRKAQAERLEIERQRALQDEERHVALEKSVVAESRAKVEKPKPQPKERSLATSHTVMRGETLPQIAARPDVYADYRLWPLLYRANRDQIRDPKHIWPGQVLRIPRNLTREELSEARRYAQEKPI